MIVKTGFAKGQIPCKRGEIIDFQIAKRICSNDPADFLRCVGGGKKLLVGGHISPIKTWIEKRRGADAYMNLQSTGLL